MPVARGKIINPNARSIFPKHLFYCAACLLNLRSLLNLRGPLITPRTRSNFSASSQALPDFDQMVFVQLPPKILHAGKQGPPAAHRRRLCGSHLWALLRCSPACLHSPVHTLPFHHILVQGHLVQQTSAQGLLLLTVPFSECLGH